MLRKCNYVDLEGANKSLVIYEEHIDKPFLNVEIVYMAIFFCEKDNIVPFVKNDADENKVILLNNL